MQIETVLPQGAAYSLSQVDLPKGKPQPLNPLDLITKLKNSTHEQLVEATRRLGQDQLFKPQSLKNSSKEHLLVKLAQYLSTDQGKELAYIKWPM
jgi:hypothetical protein